MKPISVDITNFKTFQQARLDLPKDPGLYLMSGENKAEPELGANGTGKSSTWDALSWCLYGKTARSIKAAGITPWAGGKPAVEVIAGGHTIRRAKTGKLALTLDGDEVEQAVVDDLLGLDYTCFMHTVLMGQFSRYFFDLSPTEKLTVFTEALGLEVWAQAAKEARRREQQASQAVGGLKGCIQALDAQVETITDYMKDAENEALEWQGEHDAAGVEIQGRIDALEESLAGIKKKLKKATNRATTTRAELEETNEDLCRLSDERDAIKPDITRLDTERQAANRDIAEYKDRRTAAKKLLDTACPTCRQPVTAAVAADLKQYYTNHIQWIIGERDAIKTKLKAAKTKLKAAEKTVIECAAKADVLEEQHDEAERNARGLRGKKQTAERDLQRELHTLAQHKNTDNPHADQIAKAERDLDELNKQRKEDKKNLRRHQQAEQLNGFWTTEFKQLRLWLVEQALAELSAEVGNALIDLGLEGWSVKFDIERETKGGSVSRGFHVLIQSPSSGSPAPWDTWSGGETQRLRIAGAAGLASLIARRRGVEPWLEVWDEPTAHLSAEGVDDLLNWFAARAEATKRQIWLVDHRSLDAGQFAGKVMVTRTSAQGSIIAVTEEN